MLEFNYRFQVWLKDGIIQDCGHPATMRHNGFTCCNAHNWAGMTIEELLNSDRV